MTKPIRMGTAAVVVAASVLLSRLLGLVREALIAGLIGVNENSDLYFDAFLIPDFLNYLLAGAYLTITLVPILSKHLENGEAERASQAFTSVFRFVAWVIVGLTLLMWIFAEPLVGLAFPEVASRETLVELTRIVLPAQVFLVLGALLMAVQYSHKRFLFPALAPLIYNLGIIGGGLIGWASGSPSPASFLVGAVVGAAIGNFGLQLIGARQTGTWFTRTTAPGAVREYLTLAFPLMLGQSVAVLDEQFVRLFGQLETAATSELFFARRLNMVPVGVIAQAAGVAAFPFLARLAAGGRNDELIATTTRAARKTLFVASAATALLVVLAKPAVRLLYQYGEFSAENTDQVAGLLVIYAFSIPAWGMHQLLSRHFYAKRRMWVPVVIGTIFTVAAIPLWLSLYSSRGVEGFALASTATMVAYALSMLLAWGSDSGWGAVRALTPAFVKGLVAAAVAGAVGTPIVGALTPDGTLSFVTAVGVAVAGSVITLALFVGVSAVLRSRELREVMRRRSEETPAADTR